MAKRKKPTPKKRLCVLCGRHIYQYETEGVVGITGRMVCKNCLHISKRLTRNEKMSQQKEDSVQKRAENKVILTPREIMRQLDEVIIGQERAKQAVAVAFWKQQLRAAGEQSVPRLNLLLYGPTGCGKTALVRDASRIVGLPFLVFDSTTLSEAGYRGRDAADIIKDLAELHQGNEKLPYSVVFLDEMDKLAAQGGEQRQAYNRGTQHALLKLVEGVDVNYGTGTLSTEGMLFVFGGAFSGMKREKQRLMLPIGFERKEIVEEPSEDVMADFRAYGMEPELMGRVGQCVPLESLSAEDLKQILLRSKLSALRQYQAFFARHNVELKISDHCLDGLVERALSRGTGARGLQTMVEELMEPWMLRLANGELKRREVELSDGFAE